MVKLKSIMTCGNKKIHALYVFCIIRKPHPIPSENRTMCNRPSRRKQYIEHFFINSNTHNFNNDHNISTNLMKEDKSSTPRQFHPLMAGNPKPTIIRCLIPSIIVILFSSSSGYLLCLEEMYIFVV